MLLRAAAQARQGASSASPRTARRKPHRAAGRPTGLAARRQRRRELASVLPLIERIRARGIRMLVTTGTVTSGDLAEQRLPRGVIHQFIPLDVPRFVAPLPRSLAARPRVVRGIRSVAEHDHRSIGSAACPWSWSMAGCRSIRSSAGGACRTRSRTCCSASISALRGTAPDANALRRAWRAAGRHDRQSQARRARAAGRSGGACRLAGCHRRPAGDCCRLDPCRRGGAADR